ncbi:MAG: hypothetical protein ACM3UZ_04795 [Acidobacteriota bacterium]
MKKRLNAKTVKRLLSLPHVVGIGYGPKETSGKVTAPKSIVVMVDKKFPKSKLSRSHMVPKYIEGMRSDVVEVGILRVRPPRLIKKMSTARSSKSRTSRWRPAPGGVSIGHFQITAGTLGSVVFKKHSGKKMILSNNHVLANSTNGRDGLARTGDPILQPGPLDGGTIRRDTIARLYQFVPLKDKGFNVVDAAIAKPLNPSLVENRILGIGNVNGITLPRTGMMVKKSGRTTGLTSGTIRAVDVTIIIDYDGKLRKFMHQIVTNSFDKPGDSGSLVLDSSNRAVGLLFAGSETTTIINPISAVLKLLKIRFKKPAK